MEIGIDDLDFNEDDLGITLLDPSQNQAVNLDGDGEPIKPWMEGPLYEEHSSTQENEGEDIPPTEEEKDIITLLLLERSIQDPTKIKFEDEEGNIQERDWNSLTREEQLNILRTPHEDASESLEEDEIGLINQLRLNLMTADEFIEYVKLQGAIEYAQSLEQGLTYKIDELTDEDLFIVDLQARVDDITDEEASTALERAKLDLTLFEKQMKGIREEYKRIEDERNQMAALEQLQKDSENFAQFKDSVVDSILSLDKIGSLDINMDNDDMEEIANFILSTDSAGINYLAKALDDPQTLVRMAWFALKGEEAIDSIAEYFTEEIKKVSRERYELGLKDGRSGKKTTEKTSTVVITPPKKELTVSTNTPTKSIDDLD